jgi:hypothetical protein
MVEVLPSAMTQATRMSWYWTPLGVVSERLAAAAAPVLPEVEDLYAAAIGTSTYTG